tara:strand:+ start:160 stop:639 length:480 start_codon:yes stop_codon:yes gene_type:complete
MGEHEKEFGALSENSEKAAVELGAMKEKLTAESKEVLRLREKLEIQTSMCQDVLRQNSELEISLKSTLETVEIKGEDLMMLRDQYEELKRHDSSKTDEVEQLKEQVFSLSELSKPEYLENLQTELQVRHISNIYISISYFSVEWCIGKPSLVFFYHIIQ